MFDKNDEINPVFLYWGEGGQVQLLCRQLCSKTLYCFFNLSRSDGLLGYVLRDCKRRSGKARLDLQVVWSSLHGYSWRTKIMMFINCLLCAYFRNIYIYNCSFVNHREQRRLVKFILIYFSNPGAMLLLFIRSLCIFLYHYFSSCPPYFFFTLTKCKQNFQ